MLATLALAGFAAAPAAQAVEPFVFDVNSTADAPDLDVADGLCKTAANTCTLRAALTQANAIPNVDSIINLPPGTYQLGLPVGGDTGSLDFRAAPSGDPLISVVGVSEPATIIDGKGTDRVARIFPGRRVTMSHLSLINGGVDAQAGGGVYNEGYLTLTDVTVSDSMTTSDEGGGIYNTIGAYLELLRVTFSMNYARDHGGAVSNHGGLVASHCQFLDNIAGILGGGLYNAGAATVGFSSFRRNQGDFGGGIYNYSAQAGETLVVDHTTVDKNGATFGGGIEISKGAARIASSTVSRNTASSYGGGIVSLSALIVTNSTISLNSTQGSGGGIYNGGLANVYNTTVAYNQADSEANEVGLGAGLYNNGTFNLRNSVLAANYEPQSQTPDDCHGVYRFYNKGKVSSLAGCVRDPASDTTPTLIGSLDELGALKYNGGATQTIALIAPSTLIDSAIVCNDQNGIDLDTDQRDRPRIIGNACDIGAYEYDQGDIFASGFE
jgi:hypothetical protein